MKRLERELEHIEEMKDLLQRITDVQEGEDLNSWEEIFLADIHDKVSRGYELTDGQSDKLDEIEDAVVNGRHWDG